MEDIGIIITLFTAIGVPIASWVTLNKKTASQQTEIDTLKKQREEDKLAHEKAIDQMREDYKDRVSKLEAKLDEYDKHVTSSVSKIFRKMEENNQKVMMELGSIKQEVGVIKGQIK